jgi:integrase/recombinase XerD
MKYVAACNFHGQILVHSIGFPPIKKLKTSDAVVDFIGHITAAGRTPATIDAYGRDLRRLLKCVQDTALNEITDKVLDKAIMQLNNRCEPGIILRQETMNRIKSAWRSFFAWCHATGRIACNPSRTLELARGNAKRTIPLSIIESESLLSAIRDSSDSLALRDEALYSIYAYTGMRRSEALALRVGDYSREEDVIYVRDGKGRKSRLCRVPFQLSGRNDNSYCCK